MSAMIETERDVRSNETAAEQAPLGRWGARPTAPRALTRPDSRVRTRAWHSLRSHPRGIAVFVAVVALLVYANASQAADDATREFHATSYADETSMAASVAARHDEVVQHALVEYAALITAGVSGAAAVGGPRLAGWLRRMGPSEAEQPAST